MCRPGVIPGLLDDNGRWVACSDCAAGGLRKGAQGRLAQRLSHQDASAGQGPHQILKQT